MQFLSDSDFEKYFKMTKEEFGKLKLWKRNQLEKKHYLFEYSFIY